MSRSSAANPSTAASRARRSYDADCRRCPRLAAFLDEVHAAHPGVLLPAGAAVRRRRRARWSSSASRRACTAPTPAGARSPATTRASCCTRRCTSTASRRRRTSRTRATIGLTLIDCRITNAVKCLPPDNKPMPAEIRTCNDYLAADLAHAARRRRDPGARPHRARRDAAGARPAQPSALRVRATARAIALERGVALFDSYHCSRYNTNTRPPDAGDVPRRVRRRSRASRREPLAMTKVPRAIDVPTPSTPPRRSDAVRRARAARVAAASCRASTGCSTPPARALYVGKARDLKKRVSSYFQKTGHEPRIAAMVAQVARVETTVTRSEGEALLLENNLIKAHEPRYNILFRDDKSYPYVCLTGDTFPQLRFHRGTLDRRTATSGRFPSAGAVREGIGAAAEGVPAAHLREHACSPIARGRACCTRSSAAPAPCVGLIAEADYREDVQERDAVPAGQDRRGAGAAASGRWTRPRRRSHSSAPRACATRSRGCSSCSRGSSSRAPTAGDIDVVAGGGRAGAGRGQRRDDPRRPARRRPHVLPAARRRARRCDEVVPAFLAQHYLERPVPPTIIAPEAATTPTRSPKCCRAQSGHKVADRRPIPAASVASG